MDNYGTVEGFKAYHTARGRDISEYTDEQIAAALLVSSEWLDATYSYAFGYYKTGGSDQLRHWPQIGYIDRFGYPVVSDAVPTLIDHATYVAAFKECVTPGALTVDYTPNKYKRVAVDGAVSVEYRSFNSAADAQTQFLLIDQILAPLIGGALGDVSSLSGKICRA